jgi:nickel-type superoxide dismutase maturation protease
MKSPISRFTVNGNSMAPTLTPGQDIISFNWAYLGRKPKAGEIIVLNLNGKDIVKRVVKIEDKEVYVEGDNRKESTDSRDFGPVDLDKVIGKVIFTGDD